jgi:RimJ/RimL family protein N-acetyltransferase
VGTAIHKPVDEKPAAPIEIGWHLARRAWGRGYATEAGRALLVHGHQRLGERHLIALIEPANDRSIAVARRIGMIDAGRTRAFYDGMDLCLWESIASGDDPTEARDG